MKPLPVWKFQACIMAPSLCKDGVPMYRLWQTTPSSRSSCDGGPAMSPVNKKISFPRPNARGIVCTTGTRFRLLLFVADAAAAFSDVSHRLVSTPLPLLLISSHFFPSSSYLWRTSEALRLYTQFSVATSCPSSRLLSLMHSSISHFLLTGSNTRIVDSRCRLFLLLILISRAPRTYSLPRNTTSQSIVFSATGILVAIDHSLSSKL